MAERQQALINAVVQDRSLRSGPRSVPAAATPRNEPPNVIEDQVTYPIVTALLAAPGVKVRAQTMFGDSYVFVVFDDGTVCTGRARVSWNISSRLQGPSDTLRGITFPCATKGRRSL